jgi:RHH-type transcriptional regulator, rel operon repressor / antitoxin RelB
MNACQNGIYASQMEIDMTIQTAIRLPDDIYARLKTLSDKTDRPVSYYVRTAIKDQIDDLEDLYLADQILLEIRAGKQKTISLAELKAEHGLDR